MRKSVKRLWIVFVGGFVLLNLFIFAFYFNWFGNMPSESTYENPNSNLSSEVLAADGSILGRYFVQDRSNSKYSEISQNVFNALIATEDVRFYAHSGIDGRAILRAVFLLGKDGGGSTISQQLALNLFNGERAHNKIARAFQKMKEWIMAVKLERNLTKNEIITLYLNTVPFGDNVYGIKNASLTFFNKLPIKLTVDEAAVLIGMLKGNTYYNPRVHPDRAYNRRNTVIDQMVKYDKLSESDAATYRSKPIVLDYHKIDYHEGVAPYFRQVLEQEVRKSLKDEINPATGKSYDIYKDGLKIYTTINLKMQRYAEQSMQQHMGELQKQFSAQSGYSDGSIWKNHMDVVNAAMKASDRYRFLKDRGMSEEEIKADFRKPVKMRVFAWNKQQEKDTTMSPIDSIKYMKMFLQAGFMAMDPFTGEVKAWVGGINHEYFQFDHVNQNTKRQVGSTIKPLLYCLAIDNGLSPCSIVSTAPQEFDGKPYNAGGSEYGSLPMQKALAKSVNNAALYILKQVGINAFVDFVHRNGIESKVEKYPSSALGVSDISLYEMLGAYTIFPSGGVHTKPMFIAKIEDKNGNLIKSFVPEQKEIISGTTAYKMVNMMRGVINNGTAIRLRARYGFTSDMAGKTGTTNSQADAWFIGYTPQLLAGGWVGCDDRFLRFRSQNLGQGAAAALPIWGNFMKKMYADKTMHINSELKFQVPEGFTSDCDIAQDSVSLMRANTYYGGSRGGGQQNDDNLGDYEAPPEIPQDQQNSQQQENEWR